MPKQRNDRAEGSHPSERGDYPVDYRIGGSDYVYNEGGPETLPGAYGAGEAGEADPYTRDYYRYRHPWDYNPEGSGFLRRGKSQAYGYDQPRSRRPLFPADSPPSPERGPYAGRGPRGFRRSDARIEEEVNECLTRHGGVDATNVEVSVEDGEVTLTGTVPTRAMKRIAEDAAESCMAVIDVHNRLRVARRERSRVE